MIRAWHGAGAAVATGGSSVSAPLSQEAPPVGVLLVMDGLVYKNTPR